MVSRHYVTVEGRAVHYRVAGSGPLLLLLHQSPQSSADFADLMARWGSRYTMIAPDRPGCGCSDPLPLAAPVFEDYARAVVAFLDSLGIGRVPVYGFHTGASEALALAQHFPERVTALAANGVVALTAAELADIDANYLPPFLPRWDGGHLAWLWSRMREQTIFFPWHRPTAATRMTYDVPPPERLQKNVLELLRCSDTYQIAYRAAFHFDAPAALRTLRVPALVTAAAWDPLAPHLERLPRTASALSLRSAATALEAESLCAEFLAPHAAAAPVLASAPCSAAGTRRLWGVDDFVVHGQAWGAAGAPQVLLLHDAGARALTIERIGRSLAACGLQVLAPDLPGHGESSALAPTTDVSGAGGEDLIGRCAERLATALAPHLRAPIALLGIGAGAHVAAALAGAARIGATRVIAHMPALWPEAEREAIAAAGAQVPRPDPYGGHLQYAWQRSRDAGLFHPWSAARHAAAWSGEPRVETAEVHERTVALLLSGEAGPRLDAAAVRDDFRARLAGCPVAATLSLDTRAPQGALAALRAICAGSTAREFAVAEDLAESAPALRALLHPPRA